MLKLFSKYLILSSILVDLYIGLCSIFQVKMSSALGYNLTYDVEGRYISLQQVLAWQHIFMSNMFSLISSY